MTDKFTLQHTSGQADRFSLKVHKPTIDEELAACREINAELLAALREARAALTPNLMASERHREHALDVVRAALAKAEGAE